MKQANTPSAELEALFRECGKDLSSYFARRHGGTAVTDDLVQESFLQLALRLHSGQSLTSPRGYLFGIARHLSLAAFRRQKQAAESLEDASEQVAAEESDDRIEAAHELIAALPALQREILDLRFAHGLSYAEMAAALDIPVGTVRSRLHHALVLLRQRLEEDHSDSNLNDPTGEVD